MTSAIFSFAFIKRPFCFLCLCRFRHLQYKKLVLSETRVYCHRRREDSRTIKLSNTRGEDLLHSVDQHTASNALLPSDTDIFLFHNSQLPFISRLLQWRGRRDKFKQNEKIFQPQWETEFLQPENWSSVLLRNVDLYQHNYIIWKPIWF